ncbi:hypothetical protein QMK47_01325 [Pseudomonas sp. P9_35]|uniref:hypothetical protein n=1 Tax=unclassified Pseudomonas TaxID=196821 RepID=UPI002A366A32|nr:MULTISPECIES: hypothetical protein [unclassified Pseudomonas]WPN63675.1 hypothetical protein QMK48_00420 [Pseudomonas sp. P9_32]WPN69427.1 hypothetical protein QMK47_01325 [Pseudomonas sp. P9_35]
MENIIRTSEMLSAVKWYFELKNLSLRNALALRCPLSVNSQKDLRQYYSQYFSGLLSATELFLEKEYPNNTSFKNLLYKKLSFENFPDGEKNYSYLRELRNSIIHRGLDISSEAHVNDGFPLIISPSPVTNRSGAASHNAFGYYLIEIIEKCEYVMRDVFLEHFDEFGLMARSLPQEAVIDLIEKFISNSTAMPDWVKKSALAHIKDINHEEVHQASMNSLIETLKTDVLSQCVI